jgi:gas vesicle protein
VQRPVYEERVVSPAVDPNVVLLRLEDAVGSLRTGLMIVGVLAVAALGVAIYALTKADDSSGGSRSGLATDAHVSQLDDRIDRLSRQVQGLRSSGGSSSSAVDARVKAIEDTVKTLASRPSADPQQAIDQLSSRIDKIAQDVEALKQASQTTP